MGLYIQSLACYHGTIELVDLTEKDGELEKNGCHAAVNSGRFQGIPLNDNAKNHTS